MANSTAEILEQLKKVKEDLDAQKLNYDASLDTIWTVMCAALIFFMHAGFSLLEAGSVRYKNTQNILTKNMVVVTMGFLSWYATGWAFAYGIEEGDTNPSKFIGHVGFFADGLVDDKLLFRSWLFQGAFCATGGTIVSGAMAERTQLKGFAIYTFLMTAFMYPCVAYWGWSGYGFLNYVEDGKSVSIVGAPLLDFAGGGLIHMVGGMGALVGAILVGPRYQRFDHEDPDSFNGHSIPFCVLGTFILWLGWYGFNPGSTLEMHTLAKAQQASVVAVNTTLAPCAAGLIVFFLRAKVVEPKLLDVAGFCNGVLAGLVGITAPCAYVNHWEALIIGAIAALFYQGCSMLMIRLRIDDVVDAVAVHFANGLWGLLAAGLFGDPADGLGGNGLFHGGDQLGAQAFSVFILILWSGIISVLIFLPLRLLGGLRFNDTFQDAGADVMEHSPNKAYSNGDPTVVGAA